MSGEDRHASHPTTFEIPPQERRTSLQSGDAVQLLVEIETREDGRVIDRGVDRLWVLIQRPAGAGYVGVLDSDPGWSEDLNLRPGDVITFGPEHVIRIERPPREYIVEKYGASFFAE